MTFVNGTGSNALNANVTMGFAFLSKYYGDAYAQFAAQKEATFGWGFNVHKDFAQQLRNVEMAMYYMAIPESLSNLNVKIEDAVPCVRNQALGISIHPTPFNPEAVIAVSGLSAKDKAGLSLKVYSPAGAQVADLKQAFDFKNQSAIFRADKLPCGMYVVRCKAGAGAVTKKMILMR